MPKTLRYGLIIVALTLILYLVARNFDQYFYFFGQILMGEETREGIADDIFSDQQEASAAEAEAVE